MALKTIEIGLFISSASAEDTYLYNRSVSISASSAYAPNRLPHNEQPPGRLNPSDRSTIKASRTQ
jgi:hypothetical protein